ncbi:cobalt-precorrin-5B (C(1))-methyltransferase [Acetobacteraceae bacterium KSS8]|uniref:Cobalt-precorrin-5B C(1)-methyltransferase n=1 Tax=Endosaccharibacter trunci TaxID=2812733 RepID=A0ABT1W5K4_9PROT|nr:cobalt-precorrin-5B (C(1))-methyltransferase [Acetobacteraceae bacterium KSS8]
MAEQTLRRGWTTGSCAAAAAKAAWTALCGGGFPDPVEIGLPGGGRAAFALAESALQGDRASAGVVKDAGDDPDVTHGALIRAVLRRLPPGSGLVFRAGEGVGTITRPGLPLPPGEPAINPVPRRMIAAALAEVAPGVAVDAEITVSVPGGALLAQRTLNGRLGIVGGLSILGTTGIVVPFSCAAWIDTIRRGIDVARAMGIAHVAGATGNTSERAIQALHGLPEVALIEMGDFAGGMLKYLRDHPVPRVTVAGGLAKLAKLSQGRLDLHSKRGQLDMDGLASLAHEAGAAPELAQAIAGANTGAQAFALARENGLALGEVVAERAWRVAAAVLDGAPVALDVVLFDRDGVSHGAFGPEPVPDHGLNRLR